MTLKIEKYKDIKISTKAAEGFYLGLKFSLVYSLFSAPMISKINS
jgi:hypothetical protein